MPLGNGLQPHPARQQTRIGGVAQKALQYAFEHGIFVLVLQFLREKIGDDLRLLLHVELRQIVPTGEQMLITIGAVGNVAALQREANAAGAHGIAETVLPNVAAFVDKQVALLPCAVRKIGAAQGAGIIAVAVGRHGGVPVLQRQITPRMDADGGIIQRVSEDGADKGNFGWGEVAGHRQPEKIKYFNLESLPR